MKLGRLEQTWRNLCTASPQDAQCTWISQRWPHNDRVDNVLKAGELAMRELEYHEWKAHGKEAKAIVEPPAH